MRYFDSALFEIEAEAIDLFGRKFECLLPKTKQNVINFFGSNFEPFLEVLE